MLWALKWISFSLILIISCEDALQGEQKGEEQYLNEFWGHIVTTSTNSTTLAESVMNLGSFLGKFTELELGIEETKAAYESVSFDAKQRIDPLDQVKKLSVELMEEMETYQEALDRLVTAAKLSYQDNPDNNDNYLPLCCDMNSQMFHYNDNYKLFINTSSPCWTRPAYRKNTFVPGKHFSNELIRNNERLVNLKWQYFVSPDGVQVQFPSSRQNCPKTSRIESKNGKNQLISTNRKPWLLQKSSSDTQIHKIIFLIQLDDTTDSFTIKSIKNIVYQLLKLLDESDEIGIISSESNQLPSNFICDQMLKTSSWTRFQIINYLTYLENRYKTPISDPDADKPDHYRGLEKAISMACQNTSETSNLFPPCATTIIQLSSSEIDISKFKSRTLSVNCPIFIESLFLKSLNHSQEEEFRKTMQNVASKNIWRVQVFSIGTTDPNSFAEKVAGQLNTKKEWWSFSDILSQFFPQQENQSQNIREFSLPLWNHFSKELVVIAKRFVFHNGKPLGLISVEIPLSVFTQHVLAAIDGNLLDNKNYVFIIDRNGKIVMHPAFGRPEQSKGLFASVSIEEVEVYKEFPSLKRKIISEKTGCASLLSGIKGNWITYSWAHSLNYVTVLVLFGDSAGCNNAKHEFLLKKNALSTNAIQHHLLLDKTLCCYNQLVTVNKAGLYLTPSAFLRPAEAICYEESTVNIKRLLSLMAYIGDHSGMIQNPRGELKASVKHHIGVIAPIVQIWKQRYFQSDWNKYILRRFATAGGATFLLVYPGHKISSGYVLRSAMWYRKAMDYNGKLVFLPPKFDAQAQLPVVTIAQVINLNLKTPFSQNGHEKAVAVVGADTHAGFLEKLLEDLLPECKYSRNQNTTSRTRCFLIDESGVVIYHPHLIGSFHSTSSEVHITQLEPLSIIDMMQQSANTPNTNGTLLKLMCHKVADASVTQGSLKRIYKFTISEDGVNKQQMNGDACSTYEMMPVADTNLILGIVRDNCTSATAAFCPCSRVDNLCLNCLRMEQSDCECPCECPREPSFCTRKDFVDLPGNIQPCEFPFEDRPMVAQDSTETTTCQENKNNNSFSCDYLKTPCSAISEPSMCKGSWDCEWCAVNSTVPKCSRYSECYDISSGKAFLFSNDAFDDGSLLDELEIGQKSDSQITVLPVLGVLSVFTVFITIVIYCYRHRALSMSDSQPNLYLLPLQDNLGVGVGVVGPPAQYSDSDSEGEGEVAPIPVPIARVNRRRRGHSPILPPPPPRSPVASTVSDLGYSTMTGENASECGGAAGPSHAYSIPIPKSKSSSSPPAAAAAVVNLIN